MEDGHHRTVLEFNLEIGAGDLLSPPLVIYAPDVQYRRYLALFAVPGNSGRNTGVIDQDLDPGQMKEE